MGILTQLETDYEVEIVDEFLTHFGVMSTSLEPLIIDLGKKELFEGNINEIFRIFHNIKSASGFLHIEPLTKFTKLCEDVLEDVRMQTTQDKSASDELIDWLLLASDELELYRRDIESDSIYLHPFNPALIRMPRELFAE
nr:Hpt domain-containing protein [Campylobacter sp.]